MQWTQTSVLEKVEKQLQNRIISKHGWRKKIESRYTSFFRIILYVLFGRHRAITRTENNRQNLDLGVDVFGRDIAEGMLKYVELIKKRGLRMHTVLVMGSRAKGKCRPESDVDVAIIASNLPEEKGFLGLKKSLLLSDRPIYIGVEPSFCCTKKEFLQRLENFDLAALDAIYYGKVVYDDGFWVEAKRKFNEIERKLELPKTNLRQKLFVI